jgi:transposase InsO family protein
MQVAPSGYWRHAAQQRNPTLRCARVQRDDVLSVEIERVWQANLQVYGVDKVWRQLRREGTGVARCTVERLMRKAGLRGVIRGKVVRTTVADTAEPCPLDRVNRQFKAQRPNQLWVSDFAYVSTWQGFVYVAFVIDVFARRIVGWRVSSSMKTDFVLDALEQALYARQPERNALVHHSDRGSQYVSIKYSERLAEAGIEPSVGSKGDSYDNALAETINGLYKAELIHRRAPWKTREAVELATLEWVSWFNHHRLLEPLGYIPPFYASSAAEASELIDWYRARWESEMLFNLLKNGCMVEEHQPGTIERMERAMALYLVVAWRIASDLTWGFPQGPRAASNISKLPRACFSRSAH